MTDTSTRGVDVYENRSRAPALNLFGTPNKAPFDRKRRPLSPPHPLGGSSPNSGCAVRLRQGSSLAHTWGFRANTRSKGHGSAQRSCPSAWLQRSCGSRSTTFAGRRRDYLVVLLGRELDAAVHLGVRTARAVSSDPTVCSRGCWAHY